MTDLSTQAAQAQHYAPIRSRLWGEPAPVKRIAIPAPPPAVVFTKAASQPAKVDRYAEHPDFGPSALGWRQIIKAVCIKHDISVAVVMGDSRRIDVSPIRHECFYRVHTETTMSKNQIGVVFGRDHTTVMHGISQHIKRAAKAGTILLDRPRDKGKRTVETVYQLRQEGLSNKEIAERLGRNRDYVAAIVCMLGKVEQIGAAE